MLTGEDIQRCMDEHNDTPKQLVVIDTMQFFEIEIPADVDPEDFLDSDACRKECADRIINQTTDLNIDRVLKTKDAHGGWHDPT